MARVGGRAVDHAAIGAAVASVAIVVAFGLTIRGNGKGPLGIDIWWHDLVSLDEGSPAFIAAAVLARAGSAVGVSLCGAILAVLLFYREFRKRTRGWQRWRDGCVLITAMLIGVLCSEAIKQLIARPRPADALLSPAGFSYPSGHSMGAAVLGVSLMLIAFRSLSRTSARWITLGAVIWMLAMIWSRAALNVHWFTDTIAGALLGFAAAIIANTIWRGSIRDPSPVTEANESAQ